MAHIYLWENKLGNKADIIIKVPLYYKEVRVFIGKERFEDFKNLCQSIAGPGVLEDERFEYATGLTMGTYVFIEDGEDKSTTIHELYHATSAIKKISGIEDEEAEAYLNAWIVANYLEKYDKWKANKVQAAEVQEGSGDES
jgi:hypothetical protein